VCVIAARWSFAPGTRTVTTIVCWCTSMPAHRSITLSITALLLRLGGAWLYRLCSACSGQQ
jgi:hypothetical protein